MFKSYLFNNELCVIPYVNDYYISTVAKLVSNQNVERKLYGDYDIFLETIVT